MSSTRPQISIIAALARKRVIGRCNAIPWQLPQDLRRFKALTLGAPIIMGRKTQEAIGRVLPGRSNIVISRHAEVCAGCLRAQSIEEALALAQPAPQVHVIGGAQIYALALPLADILHLTEIDAEFDGDTWFPPIEPEQWQLVSHEAHSAEGAAGFKFAFADYARRRAP